VFYLLLILLVTWLILAALLWGGGRLAQVALYEDPSPELYWRGPVAAAAVTVYLGLWCLLNYAGSFPGQSPRTYDTLFTFATEHPGETVKEFWAVNENGVRTHYRRKLLVGIPTRSEFRDDNNNLWTTTRARESRAILIKDKDQEVVFNPLPDNERWVEESPGKRFMNDRAIGRIITPRTGRSLMSGILNLLHLVVWFLCLWLLMRFQWTHALLGAAVLWLVMTFAAPTIFDKIPAKPAAEVLVSNQ
jgi:hypothetical protein